MTRMTEPGAPAGAAVRLTAVLPKDDANGLRGLAKELLDEPRRVRYAVVALDVARRIVDVDADAETAVVRVQEIEVLDGRSAEQAAGLLRDAREERTGSAELDFEDDT